MHITSIIFNTFFSNYYKFLKINRWRYISFVCIHSQSNTNTYGAFKFVLSLHEVMCTANYAMQFS